MTANSATPITFALAAASLVGPGFTTLIRNIGAGTVTIDPDGAATINSAATLALAKNQSARIYTKQSGSNWRAQVTRDYTREVLDAARTYYVRTDGSDSNEGLADSAAGAFLTIQKAITTCYTIDQNGFTITIQVATGTYTAGAAVALPFTGPVTLRGDPTTPANVLISVTNDQCVNVTAQGEISITGFKLVTTSSGQGLRAAFGGRIFVTGNMDFGAVANAHMHSTFGSQIVVSAAYDITAGAQYHMLAQYQSLVYAADARLWGTAARTQSIGTAAIRDYFANGVDGIASRSVAIGSHATRVFGDVGAPSV